MIAKTISLIGAVTCMISSVITTEASPEPESISTESYLLSWLLFLLMCLILLPAKHVEEEAMKKTPDVPSIRAQPDLIVKNSQRPLSLAIMKRIKPRTALIKTKD